MFDEKLVHLDLKGAPPKPDYLEALFPFLKKWGATGLCIEWEDMLPYEGDLEVARSPYAYSREDVASILAAAQDAGLSVIPLIQTFGHLEFLLKHREFSNLREKPEFQMDLCPSRPESLPLIKSLIDQVASFHPEIDTIHLGGDEVWSLGSCPECSAVVEKDGKAALYLKHMRPLLEYVKSKGLRSIIWDDMMRDWDVEDLKPMADLVDPVVWRYGENIEAGLPDGMWERFSEAFGDLWAASAFKGAGGADIIWPPMQKHVRNHLSWIERAGKTPFKSIIITGWSRYNHNAATCEILPAGLPSLALCLAVLEKGGFTEDLRCEVMEGLGLGDMPLMHRRTEDIVNIPQGNFPGAEAFSLIGNVQGAKALAERAEYDKYVYFPRYNGGRQDLYRWSEIADRAQRVLEIASDAEPELERVLPDVLFKADVTEFMNSKVEPLQEKATGIAREAEELLAQ